MNNYFAINGKTNTSKKIKPENNWQELTASEQLPVVYVEACRSRSTKQRDQIYNIYNIDVVL